MGKIKDIFIDTKDYEIAQHEIGHLRDLCDSKDMVIFYQKELLNVQGESLKRYRKELEELEKIKNELKEIKNEKEPKRKNTRLSNRK